MKNNVHFLCVLPMCYKYLNIIFMENNMNELIIKLNYFKSLGEVSSARFDVEKLVSNWEKEGLSLAQIVNNLIQLDMQ